MTLITNSRSLSAQNTQIERFKRKCNSYDVTYSQLESENALNLLFGQHVIDKMATFNHLDKLKTFSEIKLPFSKEVALQEAHLEKIQDLLNIVSNNYDSYKTSSDYFVSYLDSEGRQHKVPITSLSKIEFFNIVFSPSTVGVFLCGGASLPVITILDHAIPTHLTHTKQLFETCKANRHFPENSVLTRPDFDITNSSFEGFLVYCVENKIDLDKTIFDLRSLNTLFEEHKSKDSRVLHRHIDKEGMLEELSMQEMSFENFKHLVLKHGLNNVVFQTKIEDYSLRTLSELGVLAAPNNETGSGYELYSNFEYTGLGFQSKDRLGAFSQRIQPLDKLKTHDGKYYLEVCSHVPKVGHIFDQGHASIKLISSQGHVFCLGVYPDERSARGGLFDTIEGQVQTKEESSTYSPNSWNHKSTRLELPTEEDFLRLKTFIESKIQAPDDFQQLNRNCARFAHDVAMHAKSNCNAHVVRPFSLSNLAIRISLAFRLYFYRCAFSFIQAALTLNPRSFFKRVYLPQDMQLIT